MNRGVYRSGFDQKPGRSKRKLLIIFGSVIMVLIALGLLYKIFIAPTPVEQAVSQLQFDSSISESEKQAVRDAIQNQSKTYDGEITVSAVGTLAPAQQASVLGAYVPVTKAHDSRQKITTEELAAKTLYVPADLDNTVRTSIANAIGSSESKLKDINGSVEDIKNGEIALIPADQISPAIKLLALNDGYYLDTFTSGAVFRETKYSGEAAASMADLKVNKLATKDETLKVNMSGVTALTRVMQKKLASVKDPLYFSEKIGAFMADADITHVSNEVSFREGCAYSNTLFCSPPEFIETLKDSGVDLVELTGNHNNDNGSTYNTESINLYHSLGWNTIGGGLNTVEAAKPYVADLKGSKVTFLAYNLADGAGSGAIARETSAGANMYSDDKARADIEAARQNSQFVIVNIQYAECQAYPSGYVEYPQCDGPIGGQQEAFRGLIDMGADMVIGSSAHQPQTYEQYEDGAIYYGLGNMYFDQTQWPGTERGIILTHYFVGGNLVQTKLTPTVYDKAFQTMVMENAEAEAFLERLGEARP